MANTAGNTSTTWTCDACWTDGLQPGSIHHIGGGDYCTPCVRYRMDMVLASSDGWPCQINGAVLNPSMFPAALFGGEEAFEKYKVLFDMRQREWEIPIQRRLYCDCAEGMYVGALVGSGADHETTLAGCGACMQVYCTKCAGKSDESDADVIMHLRCQYAEVAKRAAETSDQLAGLIRGVDYQMCHMCKTVVQRSMGCNHMMCVHCSAHFCYICGCEASGNSDHWKSANVFVGDKCLFSGVDWSGAAKGDEKRAAAGIL